MNRAGLRALLVGVPIVAAAAVAQLAGQHAAAASQAGEITVDYPSQGSIFPPEFPPPTFLWRDSSSAASLWSIEVSFEGGAAPIKLTSRGERMRIGEIDPRCVAKTNEPPKLTPEQAAAHTWKPAPEAWAAIKKSSVNGPATITIAGYAAADPDHALSRGQVSIRTSKDAVGAPIFYRDVPLMPSETEKGVIKPLAASAVPLIAWRLRNVADPASRVVMTGIHTCANCHSMSRDGKTLGMDLDGPQNDKGLYVLLPIKSQMVIRDENVIAWSTFRGKLGGTLRVGFMSQVSPDGQHVVTTINDPGEDQSAYQRRKNPKDLINNYYVSNFKSYQFLQVFYPTRGILAWYSRAAGRLQPLPGADDPKYVHTDAVWSPNGKYLVFARAEARDAYPPGTKLAAFANDPNETRIQYDLYRIPFNDGKGGRPEPIAGASRNGMSNSFPKISPDGRWIVFVQARNGQLMRPDSRLYMVPVTGGQARRMQCNTSRMNSWHSFSPNGRWLVFSSKSRSPYTQMFLTHLDENGNDSPAILIENSTAANRAVNIPEFVNIAPETAMKIDAPVTEYYRVVDVASELLKKRQYAAAVTEWNKALQLNPKEAPVHHNLAVALAETGKVDEAMAQYQEALRLSPDYAEAHNNLGELLAAKQRLPEAVAHFEKAAALMPASGSAQANLGVALSQLGRINEAIPHLQQAVKYNPNGAELRMNLGIALGVGGRIQEAIPQLEQAVSLSSGKQPMMLDVLGSMYAEAGRFADAAQAERRALAAAAQQNNFKLAQALKGKLAEYESKLR